MLRLADVARRPAVAPKQAVLGDTFTLDSKVLGERRVIAALKIYAPPVRWSYEPMPDEQHSTVFPAAALHGIRTVFAS